MSEAILTTPREGSSLYYSMIYLSPAPKDRLMRRLTLMKALNETLHEVTEPQVARQKIHWWHEEVERVLHGTARHPAMQAIGTELQATDAAQQPLLELLGVAADQRLVPLASENQRHARSQRAGRARIQLALHATSGTAAWLEESMSVPDALARAHGEMEQLLQLPRLLHRGYPVFSDELYERFALTPMLLAQRIAVAENGAATAGDGETTVDTENLAEAPATSAESLPDHSQAVQQLLAAATTSALKAFEQAGTAWPASAGTRMSDTLPLRILSALRAHQCRLWLKRKPDLLRERATLAPLHKLYIAWRCKRQLARFASGQA